MFEPFQNLINKVAHQNNIHRQIEAAKICEIARNIIKEKLPHLTNTISVRSFKEKTLFLFSTNSTASQELFYCKQKLIDAINEKTDTKTVEKVSLTLKQKSLD